MARKRKSSFFVLNISILLLLFPRIAISQATIQTVLDNGPADKRINIVFLSEGYVQSELNKYISDANSLLSYLLGISPYNAYPGYFNAFVISVASNESGSDHPVQNISKDTYFNSTYGTGSLQRLIILSGDGYSKVNSLLQTHMPAYDLVVMIVNDTEYGGSGGFPAITSVHNSAREIVVHEIGHSFADLTDEYESAFPGYTPYERLNSTQHTQRNLIRWNFWISPSTPVPTPETGQFINDIGIFEGAQYNTTGWYRPKMNCKMRSLGVPFCAVCAEAHVQAIYSLLSPIDNSIPQVSNITLFENDSILLEIVPLEPATNSIAIQWFADGVVIDGATHSAYLARGRLLGAGTHTITAAVTDTTVLVRIENIKNLLEDAVSWQVTVQQLPSDIDNQENNDFPDEFMLMQNYPNPFNPNTVIRFQLPVSSDVKLSVYNMAGQLVRTLVEGQRASGMYSVVWDATDDNGVRVASGVYVYELEAGTHLSRRKLLLVR